MMRTITVHAQPPDLGGANAGATAHQQISTSAKHVAILMCTYNGGNFLAQQLESIARQRHGNWTLHVSDDGSTDQTHTVLENFLGVFSSHKVRTVSGPGKGFVQNFLSLTCREDIEGDYFAWADQDDIWAEDKLEVAVSWLGSVSPNIPALYCGRTNIINERGEQLGMSPNFCYPPHFKNALVQSIAGGNTMVFNQAARALILEAGASISIPTHDWWCYQVVTGAGGVVRYDSCPRVLYRQHGDNVIGNGADWGARVRRLNMLFRGRFHEWNTLNISALEVVEHRLSSESCEILSGFKAMRKESLLKRLVGFYKSGLYRQTLWGNLGLILAVVFRKI